LRPLLASSHQLTPLADHTTSQKAVMVAGDFFLPELSLPGPFTENAVLVVCHKPATLAKRGGDFVIREAVSDPDYYKREYDTKNLTRHDPAPIPRYTFSSYSAHSRG